MLLGMVWCACECACVSRSSSSSSSGGDASWETTTTAPARLLLATGCWCIVLLAVRAATATAAHRLLRRQLVQQQQQQQQQQEEEGGNVTATTEPVTACKEPPGLMSSHATHMETLWSVAVLAVLLITTLGLVTCVVSHYKGAVRHCHPPATPTTLPMLALQAGMERDMGAQRDRQIRLHSVHTDLELDLPPSIALPDGEEIPYGSSTRLHIRDSEQESEIYQKCIRAPPNRTVFDGESPPPYRSSSAGLLSLGSTSSSSSTDWTHNVVRCHSMSSRYPPPPHLPAVIVPSRQRLSGSGSVPLGRLTMVPCLADPSVTTATTTQPLSRSNHAPV